MENASPLDAATARSLLEQARAARRHAYVPYSHFTVGAALLTDSGQVVTGCNVENVSYGLTNCAERTAVFSAVAQGMRGFRAIAIVGLGDEQPCTPCGACRQVMYEFAPDLLVLTPAGDGQVRTTRLRDLLPDAFAAGDLPGGPR